MLTREQIRVLKDQLESVNTYRFRDRVHKTFPEPAKVKRARRICKQYEDRVSSMEGRLRKTAAALKVKAREAIYFGTEKDALRAVAAYVKFCQG